MLNETIVMFDLEQTIIDTWSNGEPLFQELRHISIHLSGYRATAKKKLNWGIFSFACDNELEKSQAISMAKYAINSSNEVELLLNTEPVFCPSFEDLTKLPKVAVGLEKWELVNIYGKKIMFEIWARQHMDKDFVLFDDTLEDDITTVTRRDTIMKCRNQQIDFIRI